MKKMSLFARAFGYFILEIPQSSIEDFLNLCLRYGFTYYGFSINAEARRAYIYIPFFEKGRILTACRMWQIRVLKASSFGLPQRVRALKGRWGIFIGLFIAISIFFFSQGVIWRIDIIGNERLSASEIIESLEENGMRVGDLISSLHTDSIEQRVMINNDDIAWISINLSGTVARVEVREVIDTQINEKNPSPANIVALYDGQIISLEVYSGFTCVEAGDFVRAGELIVSGIYKTEKAPVRYTRANARIMAQVNRAFEIEIPLKQLQKSFTGEKFEKKTLNFFGKSIIFFSNYRNLPISYDIINYVYAFDPFSLGELPISISVDEYRPYEMMETQISDTEAIDMAYEQLRQRIDTELPSAQILKKTLIGEFKDGKYVLRCEISAICDIAKQVDFEIRR